ncbi:MAG: GldG family protein [Bdellovibrionota bacterium]
MNILFQCFGITGAIFLFYGLLSQALTQSDSKFFVALLIIGGLLLLTFIVSSFILGSFSKDLLKKRSLRFGVANGVYAAIVICILIVINIASQDFNKRFDLTANKINVLTDQSETILKNLDEPVTITAFFDERNENKAPAKTLFDRYKTLSKFVEVEFIDPDREKIKTEKHQNADGDIVVATKEQRHVTKEISEQAITQAIIKVTRKNSPEICFTQNHGEQLLDAPAEAERGLSSIKVGIENEGYSTNVIDQLSSGIPSTCKTVVIAGPTQKFSPIEVAVLDDHLKKSGKLIVLLDPQFPDPRTFQGKIGVLDTGLEDFLKSWGANVGRDVILEKHYVMFKGEQTDLSVRAQIYGDHPIVDPLKKTTTVFDVTRSVLPNLSFEGTYYELIKSAEDDKSWAEKNIDKTFREGAVELDPEDFEGPVNIALATEKEQEDGKKAQLIVVGDSDFISNRLVSSIGPNFDFFLNMLNWTVGEVEQISIRPKMIKTSAIELSEKQSNLVFYIAVIGIPMIVLIFGINLWWYRRRRG